MNIPPHASSDAAAVVPWRQDASVIALVGLAHGTSHFSHLLLAPLFPVFMREFGLSFAEVGWLMSLFFVVSGTGQAMSGFVVDRIGARPVLFAAVGCFLLAALLASQAQSYQALMAVAMLAGLGNAPFHPADFTILNQRVSPARLGHAFSVHGLSGNLGWALAPAFLVGITAMSDWRQAYLAAAVVYGAVLAVLFWQRERLRTEVSPRRPVGQRNSDLDYLRLPVVWWCFAFFLLSTMTLAVVQSYAPSILHRMHQIDMNTASLTVSAYMLFGAVGMVVGGFVAAYGVRHRIGSDRVVGWSMGCGALLLALCGSGWLGAGATMALLALTGFAVGVGGPSRDMMIKQATPKGATGRVYGTVYSGLDIGFAISPLVFGQFMDRGWYGASLVFAGGFLALAVFTAVGVGRRTRGGQALQIQGV